MEAISGLMHGFGIALQPMNLVWCIVGCFLGTIVGMLPGLGPAATIALLVPLSLDMDPASGIIMLAGIYYGAKYGGSTTSILLNMPGEASSVMTCVDGYEMAKQGRAGAALGIAAIASFIAGTFGIIALTFVAPPIARLALSFSSPEYFGLMCLGLALVVMLSGASLVRGMLTLLLGLWLSTMGTDLFSSQARFTFGQTWLLDGLDFVVVAIGLFAIAEVLTAVESSDSPTSIPLPKGFAKLLPTWEELKACRFAFLNGSVTGFIVGVLPGAGSTIASFLAYGIEKAVSKRPEMFGKGAPEGVAAPEGSNNADTGGALVPLLTLGIPAGGTAAILLSVLVLWGVRPGPFMMQESPDVFWGLVASMYIGNVVLLILNLPLVPLFAQLLRVPTYVLLPAVLGLSIVGAYTVSGNVSDVTLLIGFGLVGYLFKRLDYPISPLILGFVLGDSMERALRQSLIMSQGDLSIFIGRPIAVSMLILTVLLLLLSVTRTVRATRLKLAGD
jgi:putative tricarboxylic transport membrane protein